LSAWEKLRKIQERRKVFYRFFSDFWLDSTLVSIFVPYIFGKGCLSEVQRKKGTSAGCSVLKLSAVFSKLNLAPVVPGEFWEGVRRQVKYIKRVFKI